MLNSSSNTIVSTLTVNAENDAPVVTATAGALGYTENDAATAIDPGLTLSDSDSANLVSATVQITGGYVNGQDLLGFTNQNGITGSFDPGTGTLTLSGTASVAAYQAAMRSVTYLNNSENPNAADHPGGGFQAQQAAAETAAAVQQHRRGGRVGQIGAGGGDLRARRHFDGVLRAVGVGQHRGGGAGLHGDALGDHQLLTGLQLQ